MNIVTAFLYSNICCIASASVALSLIFSIEHHVNMVEGFHILMQNL